MSDICLVSLTSAQRAVLYFHYVPRNKKDVLICYILCTYAFLFVNMYVTSTLFVSNISLNSKVDI